MVGGPSVVGGHVRPCGQRPAREGAEVSRTQSHRRRRIPWPVGGERVAVWRTTTRSRASVAACRAPTARLLAVWCGVVWYTQ